MNRRANKKENGVPLGEPVQARIRATVTAPPMRTPTAATAGRQSL